MRVGMALEELEQRLEPVSGAVGRSLWYRWARATAHLFGEMLGDPVSAEEICRRVEARPGPEPTDGDRLVLLRAQEIAAQRGGDFERAAEIADEQLALAQRLHAGREEVMALNTKGIVHLARGQPVDALNAFEHELAASGAVASQRGLAISLHNLGLVHHELGNYTAALHYQERYRDISRAIGNRPAEAYGSAAQAAVALCAGNLGQARGYLELARRIAHDNGWTLLLSWAEAIDGQLLLAQAAATRLFGVLDRASSLFASALHDGDPRALHWTEEFDPGEFAAYQAIATALAHGAAAGQEVLARYRARMPPLYPVSSAWLQATATLLSGEAPEQAFAWFASRGYARAPAVLTRYASAARRV
jgi:tetratricopeptide (TPR) repeat protein